MGNVDIRIRIEDENQPVVVFENRDGTIRTAPEDALVLCPECDGYCTFADEPECPDCGATVVRGEGA